MRRRTCFEFMDQPWCPPTLRTAILEMLALVLRWTRPFSPLAPRIAEALRRAPAAGVLDLCSGAGGVWRELGSELATCSCEPFCVTLSDARPQLSWRPPSARFRLHYRADPIDARQIPPSAHGSWTLFNGIHHFSREEVGEILSQATRRGVCLVIGDLTRRSLTDFLWMLLLGPPAILVLALFVRPLRPWSLLWTYLLPVGPWVTAFDGAISQLRAHTHHELHALARECEVQPYEWCSGQYRRLGLLPVTYLIGWPRNTRGRETTPHAGRSVRP